MTDKNEYPADEWDLTAEQMDALMQAGEPVELLPGDPRVSEAKVIIFDFVHGRVAEAGAASVRTASGALPSNF